MQPYGSRPARQVLIQMLPLLHFTHAMLLSRCSLRIPETVAIRCSMMHSRFGAWKI